MIQSLSDKIKKIKCLAVDVDGVLTDGHIFLDPSGEWRRNFFIRDGLGLLEVKEHGFKTAIITSSDSEDIRARAKKLKIDFFYEGVGKKAEAFADLLKKSGLSADEIAFVGDDIIDIPIFQLCGLSISPGDGHPKAKGCADIVTESLGGRGAVREVCDLLLENR